MNVPVDAVRVGLAAFLLAAAVLKLLVRTDLVAAAARLGVPRTWLLGWRDRSLRPGLIAIEVLLATGLVLPATATYDGRCGCRHVRRIRRPAVPRGRARRDR